MFLSSFPKIASATVGALLSITVAAEPYVQSVSGEFVSGGRLVIEGVGFTLKPNAQPLFWWTADGGRLPSSLGRLTDWSGMWNPLTERTQDVVAQGSMYAYRFDLSRSGDAMLGRVDFDSDRLYVWRKKYDDFDIGVDYLRRTTVDSVSGTFSAGQVVTGLKSGATGIVRSFTGSAIYYESMGGTINDSGASRVSFVTGEVLSSATGSARNTDVYGLFRTFNHKTIRVWRGWDSPMGKNNTYLGAQGADNLDVPNYQYRNAYEYLDNSTVWRTGTFSTPDQWLVEQLVYESSDLGKPNGRAWFSQHNRFVYSDLKMMRDSDNPYRPNWLFQDQVSNGCQPGSYTYFDSLYVDDSWHRVLVSSSPTWDEASDVEVQIPMTWTDQRIEITVRLGSLPSGLPVYIYVVDGENGVNKVGYPVTPKGYPKAPEPVLVE